MKKPMVGISLLVFNSTQDKFIIGKRIKDNLYGLPGGKLEHKENFEECSKRELLEETNINISDESRFQFICSFNCIKKEIDYHWIEIYLKIVLTEDEEKTLQNLEKDLCEDWLFVNYEEFNKLKNELFLPMKVFLKKYNIVNIETLKNLLKS